MRRRLLTVLVGIPILLGAVWLGAPWRTVLVVLAGSVAVWEFFRLLPPGSGPPLPVLIGVAWVIAILLGAQASSGFENFLMVTAGILVAGAFVSSLWFIAFYRGQRYPLSYLYLLMGPLYVGFLLSHSLSIRELLGDDLGRNWLLFALFVTFATDTGAFAVGRTVGRTPLAPSVSPNKTWEGSIGGFGTAIGAALLVVLVLDLEIARWQQLLIGATVGAVSQVGDLFESKLKRLSNVKDASSIIPGHGGVLDRLDSILFALPAIYYFLGTVFEP